VLKSLAQPAFAGLFRCEVVIINGQKRTCRLDTTLDRNELDRAYSDGRIVGFFRLATKAGCPHGQRARDLRMAWLDGFAHGAWEATAQIVQAAPDGGDAMPSFRPDQR
jgi:hypothetical protein